MKRHLLKLSIIACLLSMIFSIQLKAADYSGYVGDKIDIPMPYTSFGTITETVWENPDPYCLSVNGSIYGGATITIEKYFKSTTYISCIVYYVTDSPGYTYRGNTRVVYTLECLPVRLTGIPNTITLNVGDKKKVDWSYSPSSKKKPEVKWETSNYTVASVNENSGEITAKKEGKATITAINGSGEDVDIEVVVNAGPKSKLNLIVSPSGGSVESGAKVYLTAKANGSTVSGADIYYTKNGTTPTKNSTKYTSSGVTINESCTLKAIAYKDGYETSDVGSWSYTIASKPKLTLSASPSGGSVESGTKVYLTAKANGSTVSGTDIYYTTNGTTPSKSSTKYTISGITINQNCTLKAIAYKDGYDTSEMLATNYSIPFTIASQDVLVAAGEYNSLFVRSDGSLWACGYNVHGEYGDGSSESSLKPKKIMSGVSKVASGSFHTLILKEDGTLWSCGSNSYGQLGISSSILYKETPTKIMDDVLTMSASSSHTAIVKKDNSVWVCGHNKYGELGDGSKIVKAIPVKVMEHVTSVSAGCACTFFLKEDKTLWACGRNVVGELGDGTEIESIRPKKIMNEVKHVETCHSAIGSSTFIIKTDGSLWACGDNKFGQLGDGTDINRSTPVHIMNDVVNVSAGETHTLILKEDNTLWACGRNDYGQYGDGTTNEQLTPKKVLDNVTAASAGLYHSIAAKTDGTIWSWGNNNKGQLGDGTKAERLSPVKVLNGISNMTSGDIFTVKYTNNVYIDFTVLSTLSMTCELTNVSGSIVGPFSIPSKVNGYRVISLGRAALRFQREMTSISVPSTILSIGEEAFDLCFSLETISVSPDNSVYDSRNDCNAIMKTETNELIRGCMNTKIPQDTKAIGLYAFSGCKGLTAIKIPDSITSIPDYAFYRCEDLTSVQLPSNLKTIGEWAFGYCHVLPSVTLPSTVESIGNEAFSCDNLTIITCHIKEPINISEFVFDYNSYTKGILYVPYGTKSKYEKTEVWKKFKNIIELDPSNRQDADKGTEAEPFTPAEANEYGWTLASNEQSDEDYYIRGRVSSIKEQFGTQYGNATFYISSDGTEKDQFHIYRALYLGNTKYAGQDLLLREGDDVVVCGKITNYLGSLPETVQNKAYVVSINGETTGIRNITMDDQADAPIYNLRGLRLTAPQKGINIIGGKKVVVR